MGKVSKNPQKVIRFRGEGDLFPDCSMILAEFYQIKKIQRNKYGYEFWEKIEDALFFQRLLKPQERGLCVHLWEQSEERARTLEQKLVVESLKKAVFKFYV